MSINILDGKALSTRDAPIVRSGKSISRYWRRVRADDEATELALVLRALRKVAGHMGYPVRPIYWLGMTSSPDSCIVVDPHEFSGKYPLPPRSFDVIVGQVVKEASYDLEWSRWVRTKTEERCGGLLGEASDYFISVLGAGEDIFVDATQSNRNVLSLYLGKYWNHLLTVNDRDPSLPPNPSALANTWREIVLTGNTPERLHQGYARLLEVLLDHTDVLRSLCLLKTVAERRTARVDVYHRLLTSLNPYIPGMEESEAPARGVLIKESGAARKAPPEEEPRKKTDTQAEEEAQNQPKGLDREVAEEVASILDGNPPDVDNWIFAVVKDEDENVLPTAMSTGAAPCTVTSDPELVNRLKRVFQAQQAIERRVTKRRTRRGLSEGKIDARRLYRWSLDEKIFKIRDKLKPDHSWWISLVIDASASMARRNRGEVPWAVAEKTLVSLVEAAKESRNRIQVYAYYEQRKRCHLVSLVSNDNIFTLCPSGETPSGQALLAAALLCSGKPGKSLILHVTDGGANCGVDVSHATGYCREHRIELVTIGCGCTPQTRKTLMEQYEDRLHLMDSMYLLPERLESLIRERLLANRCA